MSVEQNILREYERLRLKNELELEERLAKVSCLPGVSKIQRRLGKEYSAFFACRPGAAERDDALKRIASLNDQIKAALEASGLTRDYLEPQYHCKTCRDTGFLENSRRCRCFEKKIAAYYAKAWGMADTGASFSSFDLSVFKDAEHLEHIKRLLPVCKKYASDFPATKKRNMLFIGKAGLGKTYMMESVCREVSSRGHGVIFITAYRLIEIIMQSGFGDERATAVSELISCPLLAIDDLGSEPMYNNMTVEILFNILNERMTRRRHTLICTNLVLERIQERYGDRIASRLFDTGSTIISLFKGRDLRLSHHF
ncbi:MAG: ATP-binding protein [Christensenellales bacterium]|jgi:DNA replication protein DnaC